jgi:hypothetical protein
LRVRKSWILLEMALSCSASIFLSSTAALKGGDYTCNRQQAGSYRGSGVVGASLLAKGFLQFKAKLHPTADSPRSFQLGLHEAG